MQTRKTRFEQVPIEVAEQALRLRTGGPHADAQGNLALRNRLATRARRRRLLWRTNADCRRIN